MLITLIKIEFLVLPPDQQHCSMKTNSDEKVADSKHKSNFHSNMNKTGWCTTPKSVQDFIFMDIPARC